uniref:Histone acetyltransferase n=1 Tax=Strigamia maritima TaxID=126957 RepID=T1JP58_STRMM
GVAALEIPTNPVETPCEELTRPQRSTDHRNCTFSEISYLPPWKMAEMKYKDQILDTIDQLRNRKARPDLERICHMVERKYGCSQQQTQAEIERLVDAEIIIKVDYKGNTSYRNAAKWGKKNTLSGQILNSNDVTRSLIEAVKRVSSGPGVGASMKDIEKHLVSCNPNSKLVKNKLQVALEREVVANQLRKLSTGHFCLVKGDEPVKKEDKPLVTVNNVTSISNTSSTQTGTQTQNSTSNCAPKNTITIPVPVAASLASRAEVAGASSAPAAPTAAAVTALIKTTNSQGQAPIETAKTGTNYLTVEKMREIRGEIRKKGRPSNKRKRFKKTHGPDFVENYDASFEEPEPKCDYCLLTAACNYQGKSEDLLFCKDCNAKAHPSCMDYSADLASRSRMSPWQCMDCKTCYVCADSGDGDSMLFCDACDKGYHMGCHAPKIGIKPLGKWVCFQCSGERKKKIGRRQATLEPEPLMNVEPKEPQSHSSNQTVDGALGLPTPCESPVPEGEQIKHTFNYFTVQSENLTNNKESNMMTDSIINSDKENNEVPDASEWSIDDVVSYFKKAGFPDQAGCFRDQEIDGKSLLLLKRSDVLTGLSMKLGPALKIYNHVKRLQVRRLDGHLFG